MAGASTKLSGHAPSTFGTNTYMESCKPGNTSPINMARTIESIASETLPPPNRPSGVRNAIRSRGGVDQPIQHRLHIVKRRTLAEAPPERNRMLQQRFRRSRVLLPPTYRSAPRLPQQSRLIGASAGVALGISLTARPHGHRRVEVCICASPPRKASNVCRRSSIVVGRRSAFTQRPRLSVVVGCCQSIGSNCFARHEPLLRLGVQPELLLLIQL